MLLCYVMLCYVMLCYVMLCHPSNPIHRAAEAQKAFKETETKKIEKHVSFLAKTQEKATNEHEALKVGLITMICVFFALLRK